MKKLTFIVLAVSLMLATKGVCSADEYKNYLIWANPQIDLEAYCDTLTNFDHTAVVKGRGGSMVWVRGIEEPPLKPGMLILANSYKELWQNPLAQSVYEDVCPPGHYDENGNFLTVFSERRLIGSFAGCEDEMEIPSW